VHPTLSLEVGSFNILGKPLLYLTRSFIHTAGYIFWFCLNLFIHSQNVFMYSPDHLIQSPDLLFLQSRPPFSTVQTSLFTVWTLFSNVHTFICKVGTTFYLLHTNLFLSQYVQNLYEATLCFNGFRFIYKEDDYNTKCTPVSL